MPKTISDGIKEAHHLDDRTVFEYLKTKRGIKGNYNDQELLDIINE